MPPLQLIGKGCYIWQPKNIGTPEQVAEWLVQSKTNHVAIKIHDAGYVYPDLEPYINAIRAKGIKVGAWGYVYLKWNPWAEGNGAVQAILHYRPDYYLIDAEAEALYQYAAAKVFAGILKKGVPNLPIGLNSYWKPSWHPALPYYQLRQVSDYDAPQVYWRGYQPVEKLKQSKLEYSKFLPKLPFALPAGDMYIDRDLKPTPDQVVQFLMAAYWDPDIQGVTMWSMDQKKKVPELWAAYSSFVWDSGDVVTPPIEPPAPQPLPLYSAVVNAWDGLIIRSGPGTNYTRLDAKPRGYLVDVYGVEDGWAWINREKSRWMFAKYLTKV
jgi:hypothetical protein